MDKYIGESARVVREMFGYAKVRKTDGGGASGAAEVPFTAGERGRM